MVFQLQSAASFDLRNLSDGDYRERGCLFYLRDHFKTWEASYLERRNARGLREDHDHAIHEHLDHYFAGQLQTPIQ